MTMERFDLIVIGAGPAGISAALEAESHGARVVLLDEQPTAGGQIYRNVLGASAGLAAILGPDYMEGRAPAKALERSDVDHRAGVTVWHVGAKGLVCYSQDGTAVQLRARHILLATGATERPVPLPGWTLPGVMTAGAAQILLKSGGIVAEGAVLVGSGPLLYLVAAQMLGAGQPPRALVETQSFAALAAAMQHLPGAVRGWRQLVKGLALIARLRRGGVRRHTGASEIAITGKDRAEAVEFTARGKRHRIETGIVLLHQGVVPNTQISRALRLDHRYDAAQRCFHPVTDAYGQSSLETVTIAGDGAGIAGAGAAAFSGRIAALNALHALGRIGRDARDKAAEPLIRARAAETAIRAFLDRAYCPPDSVLRPTDDTIVCRCEEVTAGDIRRYVALGCKGVNQLKALGRPGMGPCQGRFCGLTVTEILASETGQSPDETGAFRIRTPIKPVTLGELASLPASDTLELTE